MTLVSAVITTHKRTPEVVERAVRSVLSQTHKNMELFVVDDSPSDYEHREAVKAMVESYADQKVTYIAHEKCSGACVARNRGLAAASGAFIGFLDDDDEWVPEKVECLLEGFDQEDVALVYCNYVINNDVANVSTASKVAVHTGHVFDALIMGNFIGSTSFPLLRTEAVRAVGGFDPEQPAAQDFDVWLKIAKNYRVNYVDKPLNVYHRHGEDQISKSSDRRIRGLERIMEKHREYLLSNKKAYWKSLLNLIPDCANNKQYGKAFATWFKAVFKRPFAIKMNFSYLLIIAKSIVKNIV